MGHAGSASTGAARDVHQTKQMQRVLCVGYTLDHKFLVTRSSDTNLCLWKT